MRMEEPVSLELENLHRAMRNSPIILVRESELHIITAPGIETKVRRYFQPALTGCQNINTLTYSEQLRLELIFNHGRNTGLDTPNVVAFCKGFARCGCIMVFEGKRPIEEESVDVSLPYGSLLSQGSWRMISRRKGRGEGDQVVGEQ